MNDSSVGPLAWVNGSDAPEKSVVNLGFMALSDCASVIVAATQGFAQPYGLTINLKRQASWATLRDKLVSGELDVAHSLYGLIYAVHLGFGGVAPSDMAVLMGLNQNGQSLNLSHGLQQLGVTSPEALDRHAHQTRAKLTFAQTSPPVPTRCGCITGWRVRAFIRCRTSTAWWCRRRKWSRTCKPGASMVSASVSRGRRPPCNRIWGSPWRPARASGPIIRRSPRLHPRVRRAIPQQRPGAGNGDSRGQPFH